MDLRAMMIGAHPDDPEASAGGTALKYLDAGWTVMFVSLTNGDAGHQTMARAELAERRRREADQVARIAGLEYVVFDEHDGELQPTLDVRRRLIGVIRAFAPDIVFSHPLVDYHPDHRYTSQIVMDTAYMLGVPAANTVVPAIRKRPVYAWYASGRMPRVDAFTVAVDTTDVWDRKIDLLDAHESQMYEWLPFDAGDLDQVPATPEARKEWLSARWRVRAGAAATAYRDRLIAVYGRQRADQVATAEVFTASPVSLQLTEANYRDYFPFL
ncbi:MAG: PIG-L family deacetylase [Spirochaetaceae bacterium]|nr:MAG: PIG-L family deacetylase [Spirochaetaceae bacterium]